ncbi:hypothetical protein KC845_03780 [Candidatus Kaiserbacteria bacterium]|nr:hypothetical protein [Candidatus Kaiserbacteria bacterium]
MTYDLTRPVKEMMKKNERSVDGNFYTLPSSELYPFQWLWDSCFHALIYNQLGDTDHAKQELLSATAKPLPNGLLPHIIYWQKPPAGVSWGREQRGDVIDAAWGTEGVSAITQPPLIARAVLDTYQHTQDDKFLKTIWPRLVNYFSYLRNQRTYQDTELLYIINPDESGEDNSPRYDTALSLSPRHSKEDSLDKRIDLMHANATCQYDTKVCMLDHFAVIDVGFNAIYLDGLEAMSTLSKILEEDNLLHQYKNVSKKLADEMRNKLLVGDVYLSFNILNKQSIPILTWNIFMPLFCGLLSKIEAKDLVTNYLLNPTLFYTSYGIPTTALNEISFDDSEDGFWRGPIWHAPHFFIEQGLRRYGFSNLANELNIKSLNLIKQSGFREHYHHKTGQGLGATGFTWGALTLI